MRIAAVFLALAMTGCASAPLPAKRVEQTGYISLGGIDQWVTMRGEDDRKPLLLLLHGGPGDAQSPFVTSYRPYERDFVLVQWDQRGAGRTFARHGSATPDLTLDQQTADGIALAEHLKTRFPGNDLVVFGHSWGSVIATNMAQQRPDLFDAYAGTGQVSSWAAITAWQFGFLKDRAREANDATLLASLEAIGAPDPTNIGQYFSFTRPLRGYQHETDKNWLGGIAERAKADGETDADLKAASDGMGFSGQRLIQTLVRIDLTGMRDFAMPYCIVQGRHDLNAPADPAKAYFDTVSAPRKQIIVVENAGHFALATHATEVSAALMACLAD